VRAAALLIPVALALGACGGGDDRLSAEELRQQADAICAEYESTLDELGEPATLAELATYAEEASSALSDGLADLRELEPPEELEDDYDAWLATGDDAVEQIDELQTAAEDEDQAAIDDLLASAGESDEESDRLARAVGLEECSND
jgi:hypothetical protein